MKTPPAKSALDEKEELRQLAELADAISGLTHALNNHLNGIVLQAAALQLRLPTEFREPLDRIRKEGSDAANLFRPIQMLRQQARQTFQPIELGPAMQAFLSDNPDQAWTFQPRPTLRIAATGSTIRRMFQYLFEGIRQYRRPDTPGAIALAASPSPTVSLEFQLADADAKSPLERLAESQEHDLSLTFLAVRSLVRLLEGRIEVAFPDDRSANIRLVW